MQRSTRLSGVFLIWTSARGGDITLPFGQLSRKMKNNLKQSGKRHGKQRLNREPVWKVFPTFCLKRYWMKERLSVIREIA